VQGKPAKTAELSNALYQWFVDHRMTIAGRLGIRQVLAMARSMMLTLSLASVSDDVVPEPPQLSYKWLSRWRHVWGVSFRKPTKRFKVRRSILKQRLLIYWSNLLALRWFMKLLWNKEPLHEQYDQKGVHYNEAGSKQMPTYELPGRRDPPIRENHAQTRERVSWMTCTWSNLAAAGRPIPLEMLFKAKGKNVLNALRVPDAQRYTLQTSPSGSYRAEHVVEFLRRHLLPWSPERDAARDYRILSLDAYAAHKDPAIHALAWERGYYYHD
jgi:hypothetical protein